MAFRRQLHAGYSAFLVISIAAALLAVVELHTVGAGQARVARRYTAELLGVERVRFQAERIIATARGYLMMRAPDYLDRLQAASAALDVQLADLRKAKLDPDSDSDLRAIADDVHDLARAASSVANEDTHEVDRSFETMLRPQRTSLQQHVDALAARERGSFEASLARSQKQAEHAGVSVAIASIGGLVISMLLAIAVMRRLARLYEQQHKVVEEARRAAAAREEMLAIVSHDLRNPLATIGLASDLLVTKLASTSGAAEASKQATTIQGAAERMNHLVDQILDAAQIDAGTLRLAVEGCDVASLIHAAVEMFAARASQAGIWLRCEPPAEAVIVRADKERAIQVLANLIGNALKFTPAGGAVVVRAVSRYEVAELQVDDTGSGIPPEQQAHLFDRYWQGANPGAGRGVGLGLYICRKLVEAQGGRISVESRPGHGSCFRFTLPCLARTPRPEAPSSREPRLLTGAS